MPHDRQYQSGVFLTLIRALVVVVAMTAVALALGCSSSGDRPGNPAVYDRISSMTDRAELQAEFDQADENRALPTDDDVPISYMEAADARMSEIGCYD